MFTNRRLGGSGGAPGEARGRSRRDQRDRNPQRENKSEQRRMPHPEKSVKKKRRFQENVQQRTGITDAGIDSRKQLRDRHPLPQAMPGSVKAASTADIGAGLEPQRAEDNQPEHQRSCAAMRRGNREAENREKEESAESDRTEHHRLLKEIDDWLERPGIESHRR